VNKCSCLLTFRLLVQNVLVPLVTMVINVNHRVTVSMVTVIQQEVVYVAQDGKVLHVIIHVLKVGIYRLT
jgi:hypothetical protein